MEKCPPPAHTEATFPIAGKIGNSVSISNWTLFGREQTVGTQKMFVEKQNREDSGEVVISGVTD